MVLALPFVCQSEDESARLGGVQGDLCPVVERANVVTGRASADPQLIYSGGLQVTAACGHCCSGCHHRGDPKAAFGAGFRLGHSQADRFPPAGGLLGDARRRRILRALIASSAANLRGPRIIDAGCYIWSRTAPVKGLEPRTAVMSLGSAAGVVAGRLEGLVRSFR